VAYSPPNQKPEAPPRRQRRWLRRTLWAAEAAFTLLVLLVAVVPPLLPEGFVGRIVARRISEALGRDVTVEGARFSFLSGLRARGISIKDRPGFGDEDFLRIKSLVAGRPSLFAGWRDFSIVEAEDAELRLVRDEQGTLNTQDLANRPPPEFRYECLRISELLVRYHDRGSGAQVWAVVPDAEVGPLERGRRPVRLSAGHLLYGDATLVGHLEFSPGTEAFERANVYLEVQSLAVGTLAAALEPRRAIPSVLKEAKLNAYLRLDAWAEHGVKGKGTLELYGLPEVPQLGLVGPSRTLAATFAGEFSPFKPHFDLTIATQPGGAAQLTASLRQIVADGSAPTFSMDNYLLDVRATARCDFAKGGLPGTRLAAGQGSLDVSLKGEMAEARLTATATLADGAARLDDGSLAPLPPARFDLESKFSIKELSAELSLLALETAGVRVSGKGSVRQADPAKGRIDSDGSLPPMVGGLTVGAEADFAQWPDGLRALAGLPRDRPASGTLAATWRLGLDAEHRHELDLALDRVPLDQGIPAATRLPLISIITAVVGGKPEAMDFLASLKSRFTASGTSPAQVRATLAGKGQLDLARLRIVGSPLFRLLADWSRRPELRDVTFERMEAPFELAEGRIGATATLPYGGGALVFQGYSVPGGSVDYSMRVRNPREVAFIPKDIVPYLEANLPLIRVTGPTDEPAARILTEAILDFALKRKPPQPNGGQK